MDDRTKGKAKQVEGKGQELWGDLKARTKELKDEAADTWDDEVKDRLEEEQEEQELERSRQARDER